MPVGTELCSLACTNKKNRQSIISRLVCRPGGCYFQGAVLDFSYLFRALRSAGFHGCFFLSRSYQLAKAPAHRDRYPCIRWAKRAIWAPSIIEKEGRYFLFFGANDIQNNKEKGGIGIAVADHPEGPYKDYLGKPLIDSFINGAQPIDQFIFKDKDGGYYLIYGGWQPLQYCAAK